MRVGGWGEGSTIIIFEGDPQGVATTPNKKANKEFTKEGWKKQKKVNCKA